MTDEKESKTNAQRCGTKKKDLTGDEVSECEVRERISGRRSAPYDPIGGRRMWGIQERASLESSDEIGMMMMMCSHSKLTCSQSAQTLLFSFLDSGGQESRRRKRRQRENFYIRRPTPHSRWSHRMILEIIIKWTGLLLLLSSASWYFDTSFEEMIWLTNMTCVCPSESGGLFLACIISIATLCHRMQQ